MPATTDARTTHLSADPDTGDTYTVSAHLCQTPLSPIAGFTRITTNPIAVNCPACIAIMAEQGIGQVDG